MTTTKKICISVLVSVLIGCGAFVLAIPELATSRGRYTTSAFLFPYAFLAARAIPADLLRTVLILAQYPAYGLFYAWAWRKERQSWAASWLLAIHVLLGLSMSILWRIEYFTSQGPPPF